MQTRPPDQTSVFVIPQAKQLLSTKITRSQNSSSLTPGQTEPAIINSQWSAIVLRAQRNPTTLQPKKAAVRVLDPPLNVKLFTDENEWMKPLAVSVTKLNLVQHDATQWRNAVHKFPTSDRWANSSWKTRTEDGSSKTQHGLCLQQAFYESSILRQKHVLAGRIFQLKANAPNQSKLANHLSYAFDPRVNIEISRKIRQPIFRHSPPGLRKQKLSSVNMFKKLPGLGRKRFQLLVLGGRQLGFHKILWCYFLTTTHFLFYNLLLLQTSFLRLFPFTQNAFWHFSCIKWHLRDFGGNLIQRGKSRQTVRVTAKRSKPAVKLFQSQFGIVFFEPFRFAFQRFSHLLAPSGVVSRVQLCRRVTPVAIDPGPQVMSQWLLQLLIQPNRRGASLQDSS